MRPKRRREARGLLYSALLSQASRVSFFLRICSSRFESSERSAVCCKVVNILLLLLVGGVLVRETKSVFDEFGSSGKSLCGGPYTHLSSPLLSSCSLSSFSEWRAGTRRRRSRTTTYDVFYKSLATNRVPPPSIFSSFFFSVSFSSPHIKVVCVCMRVY